MDERNTTTSLEFFPGKGFALVVNFETFGRPERVKAVGVACVDDDDDDDGCEDRLRDIDEAGLKIVPLVFVLDVGNVMW